MRSPSRNKLWPTTILKAGYTAKQRTGGGQCFEFVPLDPPGSLPFPDDFMPAGDEAEFVVQTLSLFTRDDIRKNGTLDLGEIAYSAKYVFSPPLPKI